MKPCWDAELPFFRDPLNLFANKSVLVRQSDSEVTKINSLARLVIYVSVGLAAFKGTFRPLLTAAVTLFLLAFFYVYKTRKFDKLPTITDLLGQSRRNQKYSSKQLTLDEFNAEQERMYAYDYNHPEVPNTNYLISNAQIRKRPTKDYQATYDRMTQDVGKRRKTRILGNNVF